MLPLITDRSQKVLPLDGHVLNQITQTEPIHMTLGGKHQEKIKFRLIKSPHLPIIFGASRLKVNSSLIDWVKGGFRGWSQHYLSSCLDNASFQVSTSVESEEIFPNISKVLPKHHDLRYSTNIRPRLYPHITLMTVALTCS